MMGTQKKKMETERWTNERRGKTKTLHGLSKAKRTILQDQHVLRYCCFEYSETMLTN